MTRDTFIYGTQLQIPLINLSHNVNLDFVQSSYKEKVQRCLWTGDEKVRCSLRDDIVHVSFPSNFVIRLKNIVDILNDMLHIAHRMSSLRIAQSDDAAVLAIID